MSLFRPFDFIPHTYITTTSAGDAGGLSLQDKNYRLNLIAHLCKDNKVWINNYVMPKQQHKKRIVVLDRENIMHQGFVCDGLITQLRSVALAITVADCIPIYVSVPRYHLVSILHSGRKSTGILSHAIKQIKNITNCRNNDIFVFLGPSIERNCYEVAAGIGKMFGSKWGASSAHHQNKKYYIDLKQANINILRKMTGVNYAAQDECTKCTLKYCSYRRQLPFNYPYNRMMAVIINE